MKQSLPKLVFLLALGLALNAGATETYTEQKTNILVQADQPQFTIKLKSNPTTGYSWFLTKYNSQLIAPVQHHFQAPDNPQLIGAPGYEVWVFKMKPEAFKVPLQTQLQFNYARPWEKNKSGNEVTFSVSTTGK